MPKIDLKAKGKKISKILENGTESDSMVEVLV